MIRIINACLAIGLFLVLGSAATASPTDTGEMLRDPTDGKPRKFLPATAAESQAGITRAKAIAAAVAEAMGVTFETLETDHFLIFTDWDKREHTFLKNNMERAYDAVCKQFNVSRRENVFAGKLPVYMFATQKEFQNFAKTRDGFDAGKGILGYFMPSQKDPNGHMAMWKPAVKAQTGGVKGAERDWAATLVHEFTHAFMARYRTNARLPRWLNEGIAEVVADSQFRNPMSREWTRQYFRAGQTRVGDMLKEKHVMTGDDYPVSQTMVETLVAANSKAFVAMVHSLKDGETWAEALKKHYKTDDAGFIESWKKYIMTVP